MNWEMRGVSADQIYDGNACVASTEYDRAAAIASCKAWINERATK